MNQQRFARLEMALCLHISADWGVLSSLPGIGKQKFGGKLFYLGWKLVRGKISKFSSRLDCFAEKHLFIAIIQFRGRLECFTPKHSLLDASNQSLKQHIEPWMAFLQMKLFSFDAGLIDSMSSYPNYGEILFKKQSLKPALAYHFSFFSI